MTQYQKHIKRFYPSGDGSPLPSRVEVAIIGGGMTGVLTALFLKMRGVNAVIFEASEVGCGGTADCLGMVGLGDGVQLGRIERNHGTTAAVEYAHRIRAAADAYAVLSEKYRLRAEVERRPAVLYTQRWEQDLETEASVARRLGISVEIKRRSELPFPIRMSLVYPCEGALDPIGFLYGLARQVPLYQGVRIVACEGHTLLTEEGDEICAGAVIYACRAPSEKMADAPLASVLFCHGRAVVVNDTYPMRGMYTGYDHDGLRMISRGRETWISSSPLMIQRDATLISRVKKYYPLGVIREAWSPWDTVAEDGLPLIGRFAPDKYLAVGYAGRGLAYAMLAADMLTAEICGESHPLAGVFSPTREISRVAMRETVARLT